jgi:hypothetical protein
MKAIQVPFLAFALISISACATIVSGTQQAVFVDTPHVEGANCQLTDSKKGSWYLASTPGSATVSKGDGPLNVTCKKNSYKTTTASVDEEVAGATLGNVILGGGVGIFVDAASGAAQKYPDKVTVWMEPTNWASANKRQEWLEEKKAFEEAEAKKKEELEASNEPNSRKH